AHPPRMGPHAPHPPAGRRHGTGRRTPGPGAGHRPAPWAGQDRAGSGGAPVITVRALNDAAGRDGDARIQPERSPPRPSEVEARRLVGVGAVDLPDGEGRIRPPDASPLRVAEGRGDARVEVVDRSEAPGEGVAAEVGAGAPDALDEGGPDDVAEDLDLVDLVIG